MAHHYIIYINTVRDVITFPLWGLETRLLEREEEEDIRDCDSVEMTKREVFADEMSFNLMSDDGGSDSLGFSFVVG